MKKSLTKALSAAITAGITLLFVAAGSWSMPHGGGSQHDPSRMMAYMSKKLDLSEDQAAAVDELLASSLAEAEADLHQLKTLHTQLRDQDSGFNAVSIQETADEIGAITSRLVFLRASTLDAFSQLLNDQQREQMVEMMAERDERRGKWRSHARDRF